MLDRKINFTGEWRTSGGKVWINLIGSHIDIDIKCIYMYMCISLYMYIYYIQREISRHIDG